MNSSVVPSDLNQLFAHPVAQAGVKRCYFSTYSVTQPLESGLAHEFCIPCLDRMTDLSQMYIMMTLKIVQANGEAIPATAGADPVQIAPLNNALMSNYEHLELFAGSELLTQVSNFHLQQYKLAVVNTTSDEKNSVLQEQGFYMETEVTAADRTRSSVFIALRDKFAQSTPVTLWGRIRG